MQRVKINFTNCYGIRELTHDFDTSDGQAFLVYAPNGAMKTSFARVFADVSAGQEPKDSIFPDRKTTFSITNEADVSIAADRILVVEPYVEGYTSEKTATLLADQALRRQYESLVGSIEEKARAALAALGKAAGLRTGIEDALAEGFEFGEEDLYTQLERIQIYIKEEADPSYGDIPYRQVFNDKVLPFISKEATRRQLVEYVERYNELIERSTYFRKGVFNHNHAATVSKTLAENGFFAATHSLALADRDAQRKEITSAKELDIAIEREKEHIFGDAELRSRFEAIDKEISRNADLRQFRTFLDNHRNLLLELNDPNALRRKLWVSYSFIANTQIDAFVSTYQAAKEELARLVQLARQQATEWQKVLSIFHRRFSVPFILEVANQDDVILRDQTPRLVFKYKEGEDVSEIGSNELLQVLSTGEKRALYLLNVLFEIEARTKEAHQTVLVLDDIADSFDYKNKYAIVEYLKTILDSEKFVMLILTHNFDFYRTIQSRLSVDRKQNCLMAIKSGNRVVLKQAANLNPFPFWRKNLHTNRKLLLASIPMVRNLVEYQHGKNATEFMFLTSLLHIKPGSNAITMSDLTDVINGLLGTRAPGGTEKVIDVILAEAELCGTDDFTINLENKVILSIAIRLLAEDLMITKINDTAKTSAITSSQTRELFKIYKEQFPNEPAAIELLDRVMLMTPEAIHLNSFMYEPILDMADGHLKSLYDELKAFAR